METHGHDSSFSGHQREGGTGKVKAQEERVEVAEKGTSKVTAASERKYTEGT